MPPMYSAAPGDQNEKIRGLEERGGEGRGGEERRGEERRGEERRGEARRGEGRGEEGGGEGRGGERGGEERRGEERRGEGGGGGGGGKRRGEERGGYPSQPRTSRLVSSPISSRRVSTASSICFTTAGATAWAPRMRLSVGFLPPGDECGDPGCAGALATARAARMLCTPCMCSSAENSCADDIRRMVRRRAQHSIAKQHSTGSSDDDWQEQ